MRYDQLLTLVAMYKPRRIVEIGTNKGDRGVQMCTEALKFRNRVIYHGYDVFDSEGPEFHELAFNGKGFFSRETVASRFDGLRASNPSFEYKLIQGKTHQTLHGGTVWADFVFIDGDHRVETIESDYHALRRSKVIVFDDYYSEPGETGSADTSMLGCNKLVDRIRATVLPAKDYFPHVGGIQMAVIVRPHIFWNGTALWLR